MPIDPTAESTREIVDLLEVGMQALAAALDVARATNRDHHAQRIAAVLTQIEDLRLRNEEYDPAQESPHFPRVIARFAGTQPVGVRVAVAKDASRAIYRSLDAQTVKRTRAEHYIIYAPEPGSDHRRPPTPTHLGGLAEADAYFWDDPDELRVARGTRS